MRSLRYHSEKGETLLGMLATILLASIVLSAAATNFFDAWRRASDTRMMVQAETEARTLLDVISYDLRMVGSGMPMGQAGFAIGDSTLGTAPYPILTSSGATSIAVRLNEKGVGTLLSSDFTPSTSSLTMQVASSADFAVGDALYISNMSQQGTAGLRGTITAVSAGSITIANTFTSTPSTTFASGSIVERVTDVTFASGAGGITRDSGSGAVLLSPRSTFTAQYLDSNGTALTPPLTAAQIKDTLSAIELTVTVATPRILLDGQLYTAQARQSVALRNLNLSR